MNSQTSQLSTSRSDDEAAIRELYQQMVDGWNRGSGEVFAVPYAEDGVHVGFDGTYLKGRREIASFHQQIFDRFVKGSRFVWKIRSVRFLTADVALIHAVSGTVMAGQLNIDQERNSIQTLVAIKYGLEWHFCNSEYTSSISWKTWGSSGVDRRASAGAVIRFFRLFIDFLFFLLWKVQFLIWPFYKFDNIGEYNTRSSQIHIKLRDDAECKLVKHEELGDHIMFIGEAA
jgi:uncharacterized protein (TIGR02246 family)